MTVGSLREPVNGVAFKEADASSITSGASLAETFDTLLTLLTTQLQYQDPLDPMDTNEFTSQLVEFTGVEQAISTNKKLDQLISLQHYAAGLWNDSLKLEKLWREGMLDHVVQMDASEAEIARMQPWGGSPALIASDGLFSFGADLTNAR